MKGNMPPWFGLNIRPGNLAPPRNLPANRPDVDLIGMGAWLAVLSDHAPGDRGPLNHSVRGYRIRPQHSRVSKPIRSAYDNGIPQSRAVPICMFLSGNSGCLSPRDPC